ncbi:UNVERIFIED_CONTAM: hypothetical protein GTU68_009055 [Idotea baltica]|nr:hypothetical protein [Idotea baltica]
MDFIPLTQGALSIQLKNLSKESLLESRKDGKWIFYKLSKEIKPCYKKILDEVFKEINDDDEIKQLSKIRRKSCKN